MFLLQVFHTKCRAWQHNVIVEFLKIIFTNQHRILGASYTLSKSLSCMFSSSLSSTIIMLCLFLASTVLKPTSNSLNYILCPWLWLPETTLLQKFLLFPGCTFLAAPSANSLISITLCTCTHTNVISQTITYPNPNPNEKNLKFGSRVFNPNTKALDRRKWWLSAALLLGLGIIDSALHLTQCNIIKELAQGATRRCSQVNTKINYASLLFEMSFKDPPFQWLE